VRKVSDLKVVSKSLPKVDAEAIVRGEPHYVADMVPAGALHAVILRSPHAHARIRKIDTDRAKALPGVVAVLTYEDVPRVPFTTAGQNFPEPSPYDTFMLDNKVRFVGDRVAVAVAEDKETAVAALALIEVDYEVLPAVLDARDALREGAPVIHDETDAQGMHDAARNLAAHIEVDVGNVDAGLAEADHVYEKEFSVQYMQHVPMENHVSMAYLDDKKRVVLVTATQVPFHVRRIVARVNQIPISRVRVVKPRVGGAFGVKQEVVLEDLCVCIALKTGRPVFMELSRAEEFFASRTRHPMYLKIKTGFKRDGTMVSNELRVVANTGAYGAHALTVPSNTGSKSLPLYRSPNIRYVAEVVYTNLPVAGAFRGYGAPQGYFALETMMDDVAHELGMDPMELRRKNLIRQGDEDPIATKLGEGKEGFARTVDSCGMADCIKLAGKAVPGSGPPDCGPLRRIKRGRGFALCMHGTGIPGDDMAGATIKVNEDGSFNLLVGAADLGTGSDTVLGQMAAEVLGVSLDDMVVYSADTDYTPFDVGAYASSTTFVSGTAVVRAAEKVRERLRAVAGDLLDSDPGSIEFDEGFFKTPQGKRIHIKEAALKSFYGRHKEQIVESASFLTMVCPPPFCACFAEVDVDLDTGMIRVVDIASAVDIGRAINPTLAEGQIVGSIAQGVGYALTEEMLFNEKGKNINASLMDYKVPVSTDLPDIKGLIVETDEPSHPFGVKSVGEICLDNVAPAITNAVFNATGVRIRQLPLTPERVLNALREAGL
jgi:putative selenate reductase molybdopterin-binding subunit